MKKLITTIGLGIVIALSSITFAQDGPKKHKKLTTEERQNMPVEEKAKHKTDRMTKQLELSKEQAKQVYDINLEFEKENKTIKADVKEMKKKSKANRTERRTEIEKILTAEQRVKAKEMEVKHQEKKKTRH